MSFWGDGLRFGDISLNLWLLNLNGEKETIILYGSMSYILEALNWLRGCKYVSSGVTCFDFYCGRISSIMRFLYSSASMSIFIFASFHCSL